MDLNELIVRMRQAQTMTILHRQDPNRFLAIIRYDGHPADRIRPEPGSYKLWAKHGTEGIGFVIKGKTMDIKIRGIRTRQTRRFGYTVASCIFDENPVELALNFGT